MVFSETVTGFDASDISLSGTAGATTAIVSGSGAIYTVSVSGMTADGTVIASINAGAAQDTVGNLSTASTSSDNTVTYDTTSPSVTITSSASDPTNTSPIPILVTFDSDVTGFDATDPVIGNGTLSNFTVIDGANYSFDVTPSAFGVVQVDVPQDAAVDAGGNGNLAGSFSITYTSVSSGLREFTIVNDGTDVAFTIPNPGSGADPLFHSV